MKNTPQKIFLQLGELSHEELQEIDFNDLSEVTWSSERVYSSDLEFNLVGADFSQCLRSEFERVSGQGIYSTEGKEPEENNGSFNDSYVEWLETKLLKDK